MNPKEIIEKLDIMIPDVYCPLNYTKDYELLIAVLLSAQCTDERVNQVTPDLFSKYDIYSLSKEDPKVIEDIIRPCGNQKKKSVFIVELANMLVRDYDGKVPNNREYIESLPGVGRKTANVVLNNLFNIPTFAVDTHIKRISNRLGISNTDDVLEIENDLMNFFPEEKWGRLHHQLLLFGRKVCTARNPKCDECLLNKVCKNKEV